MAPASIARRAGQRVVCTGRLGAYALQGKYQLYARRVVLAGQGELQARLGADPRPPARRRPARSAPAPPAPAVPGHHRRGDLASGGAALWTSSA
ncbi:MAG: hypothetical protein R3F59_02735 [Myxococcota bacterium]